MPTDLSPINIDHVTLPDDLTCEPLTGPIVDILLAHPDWDIHRAQDELERLATWDRVLP